MKIHYELWTEDQLEFVRYRVMNSRSIRRSRRSLALQMAVWAAFLGGGAAALLESYVPLLIAAVLAGPCAALMYVYITWSAGRSIRNSVRENVNEVLLGPRSLEVTGQELVMRSRYLTVVADVSVIQKIETSADYTYVYISPADAFIIPRQDVPEDEHDAFVRELRRAWQEFVADAPARAGK